MDVGVVRVEVAAVVKLYELQRSKRMNSNLHPRTSAVKDVLDTLQREKAEQKRRDFIDRGIGTLQDGYKTEKEFEMVLNYFFKIKGGDGS